MLEKERKDAKVVLIVQAWVTRENLALLTQLEDAGI